MTLRFLDDTQRGWERAWAEITRRYGSPECQDAETGEVWQYMGSTDREHQFRHRALGGRRIYAAVAIFPDDFALLPTVVVR